MLVVGFSEFTAQGQLAPTPRQHISHKNTAMPDTETP